MMRRPHGEGLRGAIGLFRIKQAGQREKAEAAPSAGQHLATRERAESVECHTGLWIE
jgi:hypothetical protein